MANFKTHLTVATVTSCAVAVFIYSVTELSLLHYLLFVGLGMFGGILPDIDSDRSWAVNLVFNIVTGFLVLCCLAMYYDTLPFWMLVLVASSILVIVRFILKYLFTRLTIHRGNFHSLFAAVMFGSVTAAASSHLFFANLAVSWINAGCIVVGYLVHLVLDEVYSVDLDNVVIKRSFGSAIKPISFRYPVSAMLVIVIAVGGLYFSPATMHLVSDYWSGINI